MTPQQHKAMQIVAGMEPWWSNVNKRPKKPSADGRTREEVLFDSGVFAASELIQRYTRDEQLALAVHELCFWARREREKESSNVNR